MTYVLKQFDTPLLRFTATADTSVPEIDILWVNDDKRDLLPLDLELTPESLDSWLRHRTIPKDRAFVHAFLSKCGLNLNRPMSIINVSKGLSLNDSYWVVVEGFSGKFSDYNLYDNRFSNILALIAFTGYGSSLRTSFHSSPEFSTNGMLPKCWRRVDGKILLYKSGTTGASNTGFEPYSEFYAAQIAKDLGINAISYGLSKWKGRICSICYRKLGPAYERALRDMLLFDALICNTDRHFGNFGLLIDNATNQVVAPAPLFDHGNSLFNFAGSDCWASEGVLQEYADTLLPSIYDDFFGTARAYRHLLQRNRAQAT